MIKHIYFQFEQWIQKWKCTCSCRYSAILLAKLLLLHQYVGENKNKNNHNEKKTKNTALYQTFISYFLLKIIPILYSNYAYKLLIRFKFKATVSQFKDFKLQKDIHLWPANYIESTMTNGGDHGHDPGHDHLWSMTRPYLGLLEGSISSMSSPSRLVI